jgi:MFS family permease
VSPDNLIRKFQINWLEKNNIQNKQMYWFLFMLTIALALGGQAWWTLYNNFAVDEVGINAFQNGALQSVREIPGFLALLVIYLLMIISEQKLAAISVLILGIGVSLTGFLPTYYGLLFTTILMSFGFHYYETVNQSLTLQFFNTKEAPLVMGKLRSFGAASNFIVGGIIFLLAGLVSYRVQFGVFGMIAVVGGFVCLFYKVQTTKVTQRKGMVLKKEYWLYYVLTFLAGARRQVFVAFAVFLLVKHFGFTIKTITILFFVNNALSFFVTPLVGRAINRFGERWILTAEYCALILVFLAYASTGSAWVVAGLYVLDHIFFSFSMAIKTYFQKIGLDEDIAPTMAVGFTINHIAAVVIPVLGGWLWLIDYRIPFVAGACLCVVSLFFVQKIRLPN